MPGHCLTVYLWMNAAPLWKATLGKRMRPGYDIRKLGGLRKILASDFCPVRACENSPAIQGLLPKSTIEEKAERSIGMTWWNSNKKARSNVAAVEDDRAPVFAQHALYRWVNDERISKPRRGKRNLGSESFLPSLRGLINFMFDPSDKSEGYFLSPSGME